MKLELDVADRAQLLRTRTELTRLLSIVEFAISQTDSHKNNGSEPTLPLTVHDKGSGVFREPDRPIIDVIDKLGDIFSTSDVILALGNEGKEKRGLVKMAIARAVESGAIEFVEKGRGRRPSTFKKVLR